MAEVEPMQRNCESLPCWDVLYPRRDCSDGQSSVVGKLDKILVWLLHKSIVVLLIVRHGKAYLIYLLQLAVHEIRYGVIVSGCEDWCVTRVLSIPVQRCRR